MSYIKQLLPEDYGFSPAGSTAVMVPQDDLEVVKDEFLRRIQEYNSTCVSLSIDSIETWAGADALIVEGQHLKKGIEEEINPVVSDRHKAHKEATAFRKSLIDPIELGSQALLKEMKAFKQKFEAEQEEERKRIEGEAKKLQEEECLQQADEMEKAGAPKEAIDAVLDLADDPAREVHHATPILRSKTSFKPAWEVEVVDEFEVPDEYIIRTVNIQAIKKLVNDKKGNIKIRGIKITEVESTRRNK